MGSDCEAREEEEDLFKLDGISASVSIAANVSETVRPRKIIDRIEEDGRLAHEAQEIWYESVMKCKDLGKRAPMTKVLRFSSG